MDLTYVKYPFRLFVNTNDEIYIVVAL